MILKAPFRLPPDFLNRLNSLWFGDSASLNRRALETALGMAG
jgi:hypothetical protein